MPSFTSSLENALHKAIVFANERNQEYATLEHLLLALTDDEDAAGVMKACNVDIEQLQENLTDYIDTELANLVTGYNDDSKPTAGFQRVIQRAVIHVQSSGREEVTGANVLVALFSERESHAVYFLQVHDMTRLDAVNYISHGIAKVPGESRQQSVHGADEEAGSEKVDVTSKFISKPGEDADRDKEQLEECADHASPESSGGCAGAHRLCLRRSAAFIWAQ